MIVIQHRGYGIRKRIPFRHRLPFIVNFLHSVKQSGFIRLVVINCFLFFFNMFKEKYNKALFSSCILHSFSVNMATLKTTWLINSKYSYNSRMLIHNQFHIQTFNYASLKKVNQTTTTKTKWPPKKCTDAMARNLRDN